MIRPRHCFRPRPFLAAHAASLVALLAAAACRASAPTIAPTAERSTLSADPGWEALTLGPNDVLRVGVYGHPELSAPPHPNVTSGSRIALDGTVSLPLVGPVPVGGMTISEAHGAITAAYARFVQDPQVDVSVAEYSSRRVYVLGEVTKPGAVVLDRPLTLYQGLALAGSFTSKANRRQIVLLRGQGAELEVHLFDAEEPRAEGLCALRPDDLVFVRRSGAGRFSDEALPILQGVSASLGSIATLLLIDAQLDD